MLPIRCPCDAYYCSERCQSQDTGHALQCEVRTRVLNVKTRKLSDEDKTYALWLLDVLTKRAMERRFSPKVNMFEKECKGWRDGDQSDTVSTVSATPRAGVSSPTYADFIEQMPDAEETHSSCGYDIREFQRKRIVHAVQAVYTKDLKAPASEMMAILRVERLNSFNLRNPDGSSGGTAIYPQASMMNHSCYPNAGCTAVGTRLVFRSLRDISAGEEIVQSYLSIDTCTKDWGFICECELCLNTIDPEEWERFQKTFRCVCGCFVPNADSTVCHCQDGLMLASCWENPAPKIL